MKSYSFGIDARFYSSRSTGVGVHVAKLISYLGSHDTKNTYTVFLRASEFEEFVCPNERFTKVCAEFPHYSFAEQWGFLKMLNEYDFDLMIFPQFNAPILYNKPFTVTIHDFIPYFYPGKKNNDIFSRLFYRLVITGVILKSDFVFTVSDHTKKDVMNLTWRSPQKIQTVYNGVGQKFSPITDEKKLDDFKEKYGLPQEYFLYTGVKRTHKNVVGLLQGYAKFLELYPDSDINLVIAGPENNLYQEIPETIEKLHLSSRVHFLGILSEEELNFLIVGACAYVYPSFYEGFGIPPLEAMMCHVPVACSCTSSVPEVCGDAPVYFSPHDTESIAEALYQVAYDEKIREQCIARGKEQIQKYSWEKMGQEMLARYEQLMAEK